MDATGPSSTVSITYGQGSRISFEGSADDVMNIISAWQRDVSARAAAAAYGTPAVISATA